MSALTKGHECRWNHCPYKGTCFQHHREAVLEYVGLENDSTDAYFIDILHLEFPHDDVDQLHERLSTVFVDFSG